MLPSARPPAEGVPDSLDLSRTRPDSVAGRVLAFVEDRTGGRLAPGRAALVVLLVALLAAGAVALVVVGSRGSGGSSRPAAVGPLPLTSRTQVPASTGGTAPVTLWVDVVGAVQQPGVIAVGEGARVAEAIRRAGGLTPDADTERINLAARVVDGQHLYVPRHGDVTAPPLVGGHDAPDPTGATGNAPSTSVPAPVDLNTATVEQLDALPGVGPATAAAIVAHRSAHGRFRSVEELADVRGIGPAKLGQLRSYLVVR